MFDDLNAELVFQALKSNPDVNIISDALEGNSYFCEIRDKVFLVRGKSLPLNHLSIVRIAKSKLLSKFVFEREGMPTPAYLNIFKQENTSFQDVAPKIKEFIDAHKPVIAKPTNGSGGLFIFPNITNLQQAETAWDEIVGEHREGKKYSGIIFEQQVRGDLYRFTFVGGKLCAPAKREYAHVIGDGHSSIMKLVEGLNAQYREHRKPITNKLIQLKSDEVRKNLELQGVNESTVLEEGKRVTFTDIPNPEFVTNVFEEINPEIIAELEKFCSKVGLEYGGFDIMAENLQRKNYVILEMNGLPDLDLHHFPDAGKPIDVATEMVRVLVEKMKK